MFRFKVLQNFLFFILILGVFVITGCGGGGDNNGGGSKAITAISVAGSTGIIDETAKSIAVTVPNGTNVTALVATFATTGSSVKVGTTTQTSGVTANNFTSPVAYIVTAADATTATYTVTVTLALGPAPVNLGLAGNYAIFADTGISNASAPAAITGDMGVGPGVTSTAITGPWALNLPAGSAFSTSTQVTGKVYAFDYANPTPANVTTASTDMLAAYNNAAGRPAGVGPFLNVGGGTIGGLTLAPGIYTWGTDVTLPFGSNVTLSGGPNDVWIFQIAGTLTTGASTSVLLSGGALPKNIFWQVAGSSVTLGANAHFEGVVLAKFAINFGNQASANARLLAQTAVNLDQNAVTQPAP